MRLNVYISVKEMLLTDNRQIKARVNVYQYLTGLKGHHDKHQSFI